MSWCIIKLNRVSGALLDKFYLLNHHMKGYVMIEKNKLCQKIQELYPEVDQCGIDLTVDFDKRQKAWVVHLKKDKHELKHFLENQEADFSIKGK